MERKTISVIVPVYNVERYLEKCVNSICEQSYKELEIILVDDGSTDSSGNLCDKLASSDTRIKVIHKKNGGLSDARNAGIDVCLGEYIVFIDSDDYICSEYIEELYEAIVEQNADLAICDFEYVDEAGFLVNDSRQAVNSDVWDEQMFWNHYFAQEWIFCVVAWNKLYKRSLFEGIRYEKGKLHEDEFLIHKIVSQCKRIAVVSKRCYCYRQRESSIMGKTYSIRRLDAAEAYICRSVYFISNNRADLSQKILSIAIDKFFREARLNLDFSNGDNVKRYYDLKSELYQNYKKMKNDFTIKGRLHIGLFLYFEKLYWIIKRNSNEW